MFGHNVFGYNDLMKLFRTENNDETNGETESPPIKGCMDSLADNYNEEATEPDYGDGSCKYSIPTCEDECEDSNNPNCVSDCEERMAQQERKGKIQKAVYPFIFIGPPLVIGIVGLYLVKTIIS
jgi:hypothetical protein